MFTAKRFGSTVLVLSGVALLGTLALCQPGKAPRKVALLVGINKYDKRGLAEAQLDYAERDVDDLAALLKTNGYEVRLLKGSLAGKNRATLTNIKTALDEVLKGVNADDLVLVALSGHGQQLEVRGKQEAFYCPCDGEAGEADTLFGMRYLINMLDRKGGKNLVLVDACRDQPNKSASRGLDGNKVDNLPENTAVMFSCSARQFSYESPKAGGGHGIFFHAVLEGLQGKAKDQRGNVTWTDLVKYVQDVVEERAQDLRKDYRQFPHAVQNLAGRSPVLVTLKDRTSIERPEKGVPSPNLGKTEETKDFENSVGLKMVYIKAGTFEMGSPGNEHQRGTDEKQHPVILTRGFHLGATLVTQKQWKAVMGNNPSKFVGDDLPVETVSWKDAKEFCKKLSAKEGRSYRLPYEAEWEYACRAGTKTPFWFGETIKTDQANFDGNYPYREADGKGQSRQKTTPVMMFKANPWGLYDMPGNVYQWCEDWYGKDYYTHSDKEDPRGPTTGSARVLRGGCWGDNARSCRSAYRNWDAPTERIGGPGFRLAVPSSATK